MNSYLASIGPTLANHLWQSTAFATVAWLLTLALHRNQARIRYAIWLTASIKFLMPFALLVFVGNLLPHPKQPVAPAVYSAINVIEKPFAALIPPVLPQTAHVPTLRERAVALLPICFGGLWLAGFATVLFGWWNHWRVVSVTLHHAKAVNEGRELAILRQLEARSSRSKHPKALPLFMSRERMEPSVFGVFRPVLVWPEQLSTSLDDEHIEAIIAHELAHVRRRDGLTALVHMLVEAAFWFHPFVWWMEREMVKEREQACDEAVVAMGGDADVYAEGLLKTCRFCVESPLVCVAGISGADLKKRIVRIMACHVGLRMSLGRKLLLGAAGLLAVAVPVVFGLGQAGTNEADWERAAGGKMAFDVASVRETKSNARPHSNIPIGSGDGYSPTGGRFVATGEPLYTYINFAYKLTDAQAIMMIEQTPHWIRDEHFDIQAETEAQNPTKDQMRLMMQSLLEDRFKLVVRREIRQLPTLGLVLVNSGHTGPQLKPHAFDSRCPGDIPMQPVWTIPPATLLGKWPAPCGTTRDLGNDSITVLGARNVSMKFFADTLNGEAEGTGNRTIVDKTGLQGNFDLVMEFVPESPDSSGGTFLEALKDQLGLKLIKEKDPVDCFNIDHIEQPSPN